MDINGRNIDNNCILKFGNLETISCLFEILAIKDIEIY